MGTCTKEVGNKERKTVLANKFIRQLDKYILDFLKMDKDVGMGDTLIKVKIAISDILQKI